jgi:hypothetical protein
MASQPFPVEIPPGYVKADSALAEKGRYTDGFGVRFFRGKAQKIGGFAAILTGAMAGIIRGLKAWNDLTSQQLIAAGTTQKLYAISDRTFAPQDITPAGYTGGLVDPTPGLGWGAGTYGTGTYGTPRGSSTINLDPVVWSVANFGKILLAAPLDGALYYWDPTNPTVTPIAKPVPNAPASMQGFFVTAERFVIAYGINNNLMQFQWCSQGDYTDWNDSELTGTIGSPSRTRNVARGRKIMGGADVGGFVSLMWTDSAVYTHQYTGSKNVFNTQLLGVDCGLIGPHAYTVEGSTAFWMSAGGFYMSSGGSGVQKIPNSEDISEWFFANLRPLYSVKSIAWYNHRYREVWFAFCSNESTEPNLCAVYNVEGQYWFVDVLTRTSATRFDGQDARPILAGTDGMLYEHEVGVDANGSPLPWSITTALLELENGATSFGVDAYYPDMQRQVGTITMVLHAQDRTPTPVIETQTKTFVPGDAQVDFRIAGREIALTMSGGTALGDDFRFGDPKVLITKSGRR